MSEYVLCSCGGVIECRAVIRFGYEGECRDCGAAWRDDRYPGVTICVDCNALFRTEDNDIGCPCGGDG